MNASKSYKENNTGTQNITFIIEETFSAYMKFKTGIISQV